MIPHYAFMDFGIGNGFGHDWDLWPSAIAKEP
jgi:hypothetical protein